VIQDHLGLGRVFALGSLPVLDEPLRVEQRVSVAFQLCLVPDWEQRNLPVPPRRMHTGVYRSHRNVLRRSLPIVPCENI
jgi:hypothetical protein